jgi:hypothetical protein
LVLLLIMVVSFEGVAAESLLVSTSLRIFTVTHLFF